MSSNGCWAAFAYHQGSPIVWLPEGIEARWQTIRDDKPEYEQATRQRCLRELTPEQIKRIPTAYRLAGVAYDQAVAAHNQDSVAYDQAWVAYDQAWKAVYVELLALALEIVPDAPWDAQKCGMIFEEVEA